MAIVTRLALFPDGLYAEVEAKAPAPPSAEEVAGIAAKVGRCRLTLANPH